MRSVKKIRILKNVPVLVRAALNVEVVNNEVVSTFRLRAAVPTIEYLRDKGAKVILCGHIGEKGTETLEPVYRALKKFIPTIEFCPTSIGKEAREAVRSMRAGDVLLLENLRRHRGETMNDPEFAKELASLADVFVEDCFDVCHRKHASVVGVPTLLPSYTGFLVESEVKELTSALKPKRPSVAIIAGAKFSTKEPVIVSLLAKYDHVFIGGALANDFIRAEGHDVGKSLTSDGDAREMRRLLANPKLLVPRDVVVANPEDTPEQATTIAVTAIPKDKAILDVGEASLTALAPYLEKAKTVLWNGTLGRYETGFTAGTKELALAILAGKARSIIGGGDTVTVLDELKLTNKFSFVSTGGGAMLDFLAHGSLPGLDALR